MPAANRLLGYSRRVVQYWGSVESSELLAHTHWEPVPRRERGHGGAVRKRGRARYKSRARCVTRHIKRRVTPFVTRCVVECNSGHGATAARPRDRGPALRRSVTGDA